MSQVSGECTCPKCGNTEADFVFDCHSREEWVLCTRCGWCYDLAWVERSSWEDVPDANRDVVTVGGEVMSHRTWAERHGLPPGDYMETESGGSGAYLYRKGTTAVGPLDPDSRGHFVERAIREIDKGNLDVARYTLFRDGEWYVHDVKTGTEWVPRVWAMDSILGNPQEAVPRE